MNRVLYHILGTNESNTDKVIKKNRKKLTRTECRIIMTQELLRCIVRRLAELPLDIKVDQSGTKNYLSLNGRQTYICFYISSDLKVSFRTPGPRKNNVEKIQYDKYRTRQALKVLTRDVFEEILTICIENNLEHGRCPIH